MGRHSGKTPGGSQGALAHQQRLRAAGPEAGAEYPGAPPGGRPEPQPGPPLDVESGC